MILHTTITGEGEPLVLIHSGGMTGETEYEEQSEYFSKRNFQVIRPDLRGHGKSIGEIENYFSYCAKDINDTLQALGIEQSHIAGVSIGGIVALLFAKAFPTKVKTLTFSGVFPKRPDDWEESNREESERYEEELFNNEEAVAILNEIHGNNDWKALLRSFNTDDFYPFDETGEISDLQMPTLYMVGERQEQEVQAALTYKELNPAIHLSIVPFAGHLVHREQPDTYSQILHTFIW